MRFFFIYLFSYLGLFLAGTAPVVAQVSDTIKTSISDANPPVLETKGPGSYVIFKKDTLFSIHTNLGPFTKEERARAIIKRLELHVESELKVTADSFYFSDVNDYSTIFYKSYPIMYLTDADVSGLSITRQQLGDQYVQILKTQVNLLTEAASLKDLLINIGFTVLALLGLLLIFYVLKKAFIWINGKLITYEKGLKRRRKTIFKYLIPSNTSNIFLVISKVIKFVLYVLILFLYLPFLFSFLPWTKSLAQNFYGYIADPVTKIINGLIAFVPNIFSIAVIIIIARYFLRILTYVSKEIEDDKLKIKGFHRDWARPTFNLIKITIYILALVFIVQYLPSSQAFKGVSIFVGVLFTLGSTSAIANMIAGIVITYMRPFVIGDRVKIGETVGDVVEKNLLVTRLRTTKNEDITIPNATIINTHLLNYSKNASDVGIILHPTVTIGYDVPSEKVVQLLLEAAKNTKNITRDLKPFVLQKSLNDFYVEYELNVYTKQPKKMPHFYSELNKSILNEFNKAGVEILSPHYSAFRDGNASTIPGISSVSDNPIEEIVDRVTGKK